MEKQSYLERKTEGFSKLGYIKLSSEIFARIKGEYVRIVELDTVDETRQQVILSEDEILTLAENIKEARMERQANARYLHV